MLGGRFLFSLWFFLLVGPLQLERVAEPALEGSLEGYGDWGQSNWVT